MKITDALLGEHGVFYAQFDHLERVLAGESSLDVLRREAALLASALAPHAHLENQLLFDRMASSGMAAGPVGMMRSEHEEIEELLERVEEADTPHAARDLIRHAVHIARHHFAKEEHVAFPMAESILDEATLLELGRVWAERRGVRLGS